MAFADRVEAEKEHQVFKAFYKDGRCCMCRRPMLSFDQDTPCVHWYTHPVGFRKRDIPSIADKFSLFESQLFLRWLANEEAPVRNINDLVEEGQGRTVEITIRYRDCEWSFSAAESDLAGHDGAGPAGNRPHYHLQMRYRRQVIAKFNDFHLPLHSSDIDAFAMVRAGATLQFAGGSGSSDFFHLNPPEDLIKGPFKRGSEEDGLLEFDTIITADPGTTLKGEQLLEMMKAARQNGQSYADVLRQIPNASVKTIISPGQGVVELAIRGGRKKP